MAVCWYCRLTALVAKVSSTETSNVIASSGELYIAMTGRTVLVVFSALESIEGSLALLLLGVESRLAPVVEDIGEWSVCVELCPADHACCCLTGVALADRGEKAGFTGSDGDFLADEVIVSAMDAQMRWRGMFSLHLGVLLKQLTVQIVRVSRQVRRFEIDHDGIHKGPVDNTSDHIVEAYQTRVDTIDQPRLEGSLGAYVFVADVARVHSPGRLAVMSSDVEVSGYLWRVQWWLRL